MASKSDRTMETTKADDGSVDKPLASEQPSILVADAEAKPVAPAPSPPPNGGTQAWLQVFGGFLLFFSSWGITNTFGVFQTFYQTNFLADHSPSDISWIGTMQGFLLITVGVLSGPLYDKGHLRALIAAGAALTFVGFMTAAVAESYYAAFLSLGVATGLGSGCLFVPSVAIVSTYFTTRRPWATGITATGGSVGGVVFPIAFRRLLDSVGFAWACRTIAFVCLACLAVSLVVMRPRVVPAAARPLLDLAALREPAFVLFSVGLFFDLMGLYVPFLYASEYGRLSLGLDDELAFYLLAIQNAGSVFGRLLPNLAAVYWGSMEVLLVCNVATGILAFVWTSVHNVAGIVVFGILYGFFSGAVVSLPPTALVTLSPDLSLVGTRMGMAFFLAGFGLLIGSPIAGVILRSGSKFVGQGVFAGVTLMAGFLAITLAMVLNKRSQARLSEKK